MFLDESMIDRTDASRGTVAKPPASAFLAGNLSHTRPNIIASRNGCHDLLQVWYYLFERIFTSWKTEHIQAVPRHAFSGKPLGL